MYESESLDHEYYPVILDIGSMFLKAGIGGDPYPSAIELTDFKQKMSRNEIQIPPHFEANNPLLSEEQLEFFRNKLLGHEDTKKLCEIFTNDVHSFTSINTQIISKNNELVLSGKINNILCNKLIISPKELKVILIDSNLSMVNKFKIIDILLNNIQVKSVYLIPEPILTVLGSNLTDGLVLNFNWELFTLHAVADLRIIDKNTTELFHKFNGITLHYKIIENLIELNTPDTNKLLKNPKLFEIIEIFITSAVFVRAINDTEIYDSNQDFEIVDGVFIPNKLRYQIIEECFFSENELSNLIMHTIKKSEIDLRKVFLQNIIFAGGIANIPGFKTRMIQELKNSLGEQSVSGKVSLGSWTGCSLYISSSLRKYPNEWKDQEFNIKSFNSLKAGYSEAFKLSALPDTVNLYYRSKFYSNKN